jgi:hypothetical protein
MNQSTQICIRILVITIIIITIIIITTTIIIIIIRDSSVGTARGYGLGGRGSGPVRSKRFFSPQRPDRLWGPSSLLSNWH